MCTGLKAIANSQQFSTEENILERFRVPSPTTLPSTLTTTKHIM